MLVQTPLKQCGIDRNIFLEIIGEFLNLPKEKIITCREISTTRSQIKRIEKAIFQYRKGIPLAYCLKRQYFFSHKFLVNKNTLIPRPETEILVQEAINITKKIKQGEVIDVGTGCGNIIISLYKRSNKDIRFFAVDKSLKALEIAKKNACQLKAEEIQFLQSDLFSNNKLPRKFDLILANLPYLKTNYLETLPKRLAYSLSYEPNMALDGGKSGFDLIKKLIEQLQGKLKDSGDCIIEIGDNQSKDIIKICYDNNLQAEIIKDLNHFPRFLHIKKKTHQV